MATHYEYIAFREIIGSPISFSEMPFCSFCEKNSATAYWRGETEIFVCQLCAYEVLPKLIADALPDTKLKNSNFAEQQFHENFYRGLHYRVERERE